MSDRAVKDAIEKLAGTFLADEVYILVARVVSVSLSERTCNCAVISGVAATEINDVQIMAEIDDGILIVPEIDSTVIITYSKRNVPFISMFSEVSSIWFVTNSGIKLQGDEFGGLIKISDLVSKLNNLETAFNSLNSKVNVLAPTPVIPPIVLTRRDDLENTSIQHGA